MASSPWPPAPFDVALTQFEEYDAWYSGDTDRISTASASAAATHVHNGAPYAGGLVGAVTSRVWGRPVAGEARTQVHIPIAGDLAQLSADLLFAESPTIRLDDYKKTNKAAQDRLDLIIGSDEGHAELLRSGEYSAAHGGTFLAIVWDSEVADHVWFRAYRADCAIPEFRHGRLSGVTLWTEYVVKDKTFRLLERHVPGRITYSLWKGGTSEKGEQVPVTDLPETAHYAHIKPRLDNLTLPEAAELDVNIPTGVPWLTVEYYPNMLPNPAWDRQGVLANLGRSDYFLLEPMFDAGDFIWTSLMRDFVNGAGRLIVPESFLKLSGPGQGAQFDMFRQVFTPTGQLDRGEGAKIDLVQFALRVDDHIAGIEAVKAQIAQSAGYSLSHFGIHDGGGAKTATEVVDDRTDSERTRDKKALYVRPALSRLARTALAIDGLLFKGKGGAMIADLPAVEFADVSQIDPEKRARTVQLLDAARAISTATKVAMVHEDWDDDQVQAEVLLIEQPEADPTLIEE